MILAHISGSWKLLLSIACAIVILKLEPKKAIMEMSRGGDEDEQEESIHLYRPQGFERDPQA